MLNSLHLRICIAMTFLSFFPDISPSSLPFQERIIYPFWLLSKRLLFAAPFRWYSRNNLGQLIRPFSSLNASTVFHFSSLPAASAHFSIMSWSQGTTCVEKWVAVTQRYFSLLALAGVMMKNEKNGLTHLRSEKMGRRNLKVMKGGNFAQELL